MQQITASIITIGDEILIGQIIDTNSVYLAQELNKIGIWVNRKLSVGDNEASIWQALEEAESHSDVILLTGGLGPTADDITKPLLCQYFGGKLVVNEEVKKHVIHLFQNVLRHPLLESNLKQAEVPDVCEVIINQRGTAPGMVFQKNNKVIISMPGVPFEMMGMMQTDVLPLLKQKCKTEYIAHRTLLTAGIGESFLAEKIKDFEQALPTIIKLAYLPNHGMVRLRLTAKNPFSIDAELDQYFNKLKKEVQEFLVVDEDISLETVVGRLLNDKKSTLATAESCTGGYIAHLLTANPKSSSYFTGSVVCYDKKIKETVLNVDPEILDKEGTVNEHVVQQMVKGILQVMNSNYAIAVTGLMGPDAGDEKEPVGTTWIAVGNKEKIESKKFNFRFNRGKNIELTGVNALNMLRQFILQNS